VVGASRGGRAGINEAQKERGHLLKRDGIH